MGRYNCDNTTVLETHLAPGGNTRMLLMHTMENGNREYIIGSYFHETHYIGALGYERWDYEWDWGHYFQDVVSAVEYWKNEVLNEEW